MHVHELYYKQGSASQNPSGNDWGHADLHKLAKAPTTALIVGDPFGYHFDGFARVVYRGLDNHIHELAYMKDTAAVNPSGTDWNHTDLTDKYGGALAAGDPAGFVTGSTARVVYRGFDGRIHQLSYTAASTWKWENLSGSTSAPLAESDPTGYHSGGYARVVYRGTDNAIHELARSTSVGGTWSHASLTDIAQAPKARTGSTPRAYTTSGDGYARVVYSGADGTVHELSYLNGAPGATWRDHRLSGIWAAGNPFGYDTPGDPFTRVVYRSADQRIRQLHYDKAQPGWAEAVLPVAWAAA
jgi:hypothetical protein